MIRKHEMQQRVKELKSELETRYKYNLVKMANADGQPIPVQTLQNEMYSLIYKLSKIE